MNQIKLSKWLKTVMIGTGVCGAVLYFYIFPVLGDTIFTANPEYRFYYWPWLIFLWLTSVPCYLTLVYGFKIAGEIGKDNSFCRKNANLLKLISLLSAGDSVFLFTGNILFLLLNISHPLAVLLSLLIVFAGIVVTVMAASLSHLVLKASQMREENELTV